MSAVISQDGLYRYHLTRTFGEALWGSGSTATFVMLNPSTADANVDDPTIGRCIGFATSWGCDSLVVVNLYAFRSTNPKGLWRATDPVGPRNDEYLAATALRAAEMNEPIIAAWGANAKPERVAEVLALPHMDRLQCLGVTKDGAPRHPLYLRADTTRKPWAERAA